MKVSEHQVSCPAITINESDLFRLVQLIEDYALENTKCCGTCLKFIGCEKFKDKEFIIAYTPRTSCDNWERMQYIYPPIGYNGTL